MSKVLTIVRGVSGSGKTTLAKALCVSLDAAGPFEADNYFMKEENGELTYQFNPKELSYAHSWCKRCVVNAMHAGHKNIVVSNTFTKKWEMEPYVRFAKLAGYSVQIVSIQGQFQNVHGVPDDKVQQMKDRFEDVKISDFD